MSDRDDELRRQIGTLWRTAVVGLDTVREVLVRSTQTGRLRVDIALLQRERAQLLQTLGEMVIGLIDEGGLGAEGELPESLRQVYDRVKDVESRIKSDHARAHDNAFGAPRGYEPEAASDYGDAHELDEHNDPPAPAAAPARAAKATRNGATRSSGPSRRGRGTTKKSKRKEEPR